MSEPEAAVSRADERLYAHYGSMDDALARSLVKAGQQVAAVLAVVGGWRPRRVLDIAAGVGAILAASALAFSLIKWFGVLYLVYLGYRQWRALPADMAAAPAQRPLGRPLTLVLRGFLVNISNPKAIIFMLAVLPQFLDPHAPLLPQYLLMGVTMIGVDLLVMAGYTGLASRVLGLLRTPRQQRLLNRSFGALFIGAAALLATVRRAPA